MTLVISWTESERSGSDPKLKSLKQRFFEASLGEDAIELSIKKLTPWPPLLKKRGGCDGIKVSNKIYEDMEDLRNWWKKKKKHLEGKN